MKTRDINQSQEQVRRHYAKNQWSGLCLLLTTQLFAVGCDDTKQTPETAIALPAPNSSAPTSSAAPAKVPALPAAAPVPAVEKQKKKLEDCSTGAKLVIENSDLEASIRVKAKKPDGDLTKADLKKLRSLNLSRVAIDELDICLFHEMTELRELFIAPSGIDDLSPISTSTKLETLGVAGNPITDLSPLSRMTHLDRLDIAKTKVSDLMPISKLGTLTELTLDGTDVTDLTALSGLTHLERLSIKNTQIKDIKMLANFKSLKFLYIASSAAADDIGQTGAIVQNGTKVVRD